MQRWIAIFAVLGLVLVAGRALAQTAIPICPLNVLQPESCLYLPMLEKPLPTATPAPTALPTPKPNGTVQIISATYQSAGNDRAVVGEVRNDTSKVVYYVRIDATFLDDSNKALGADWSYVPFAALGPGQKTPFRVVLRNGSPNITHATTRASSSSKSDEGYTYVPILIESQNVVVTTNSAYTTGTLRNTNNTDVSQPTVVVTYYNDAGAVVRYNDIAILSPRSSLSFGQGATYTFYSSPAPGEHFTVQAQSYIIR